ncbi:hypothetical protein [Paenibacillus mesophilus]|nr:hypothetical protein [Paenibacillus mesophilus]
MKISISKRDEATFAVKFADFGKENIDKIKSFQGEDGFRNMPFGRFLIP